MTRANPLQIEDGKVVIHLDKVQALVIEDALEEAYRKLPKQRKSLIDFLFGVSDKRKEVSQMFASALQNALDQLEQQSKTHGVRVLRLEQTEAGFITLALVPMRDTATRTRSESKSEKAKLICIDVALAQLPTTYQMPEWIIQTLFQMKPRKS
jgi:hypothetical protein